jgi:protein SCO1/2
MQKIFEDRKWLIRLGITLALAAVIVLEASGALTGPYQYQGSLIDPASPAPAFDLPSTRGADFALAEQRGQAVVLFFGYTSCPDICPTTLGDFKAVQSRLGKQADQVEFVFITVDPARDNLARVKDYVEIFDPGFIGLSGGVEQLRPVWEAYGIYAEKSDVGSAGGYLVDHTARIYVINPEGELQLTFPQGMAPEAMADDLAHLLSES